MTYHGTTLSDMSLQPLENKALSRSIIGKTAPILAELTIWKSQENSRQRKIIERVEETFREQGHAVKSMSVGEVYEAIPSF